MAKTLEDARDGLLSYWNLRPLSGSRAELLSLASGAGFEEPLLNQWLDAFLSGFQATRTLGVSGVSYDLDLNPARIAAGPIIARAGVFSVFEYLTNQRNLHTIRLQNIIQAATAAIATATAERDLVVQARAWVAANAPASAAKVAGLAALDRDLAVQARKIAAATAERDRLQLLVS